MVLSVNEGNFDKEVLESKGYVLIDFWAEWCGPCKMISPVVEELAGEYNGRVKVGKLNVDESPNVAGKFGIRSIPTLLIFKDGELKDQIIGAVPKDAIKSKIEAAING